MTKPREVLICAEKRYYDALLFADIKYEGPLKELNIFGVVTIYFIRPLVRAISYGDRL